MVVILMMSAKFAILDLLEIKVFWNKGCDRHFRPKLVHWNESVYCTPIDIVLKMLFKEELEAFYDQPFISYGSFSRINCVVFWTK